MKVIVASLRSSNNDPHTLKMYSGAGRSTLGFPEEKETADRSSCFFKGRLAKESQPRIHLICSTDLVSSGARIWARTLR